MRSENLGTSWTYLMEVGVRPSQKGSFMAEAGRYTLGARKGVYCDFEGCDASHSEPEHAWPRNYAKAAGWRCDDTGDWCPKHR